MPDRYESWEGSGRMTGKVRGTAGAREGVSEDASQQREDRQCPLPPYTPFLHIPRFDDTK